MGPITNRRANLNYLFLLDQEVFDQEDQQKQILYSAALPSSKLVGQVDWQTSKDKAAAEEKLFEEFSTSNNFVENIGEANEAIAMLTSLKEEKLIQMKRVNPSIPANPEYSATVTLPKLELMKFGGNPVEWEPFWDQFSAAVDSKNLPPVQKLAYLNSCLTDNALAKVRGYAVVERNYTTVVDVLKKSFGNKAVATSLLHSQLRDLKAGNGDTKALRLFNNELERILLQMSQLGEDSNSPFVVALVESKMPRGVMTEICRKKEGIADWNIQALKAAIDSLINLREEVDRTCGPYVKPQKGDRPAKDNKSSANSPTSSFATTTKESKEKSAANQRKARSQLLLMKRQAREKGLCDRCLYPLEKHKGECRARDCLVCDERHHFTLCPNRKTDSQKSSNLTSLLTNKSRATIGSIWVLLDSCSEAEFVATSAVERLQLKLKKKDDLTLHVCGETKANQLTSYVVPVNLHLKNGATIHINANTLDHITAGIQHVTVDQEDSDLLSSSPIEVEMLIGVAYYYQLMDWKMPKKMPSGLYKIETKLGPMLTGEGAFTKHKKGTSSFVNFSAEKSTNEVLEQFWQLENLGISEDPAENDDETAMELFQKSINFKDGRYCVRWPWKTNAPPLPSNYKIALSRLHSTWKTVNEATGYTTTTKLSKISSAKYD
uniref:Peptidase aspartic putative domain-containing protein n=1 Tax=Ditylenchus dipsaci TaxID=166011 RepID=A0A915EBB4_9BILA